VPEFESPFALKKTQPEEERLLLLGFSLGDQSYALEVPSLREIVRIPKIFSVPRAPAFIKGVIDLRGEIVPVIDLRERFGLGTVDLAKGRIIICVPGFQPAGFLVDRAREVFSAARQDVKETPGMLHETVMPFVKGMVHSKDNLYYILHASLLLTEKEQEALAATRNWKKAPSHGRKRK
jgi:purine-binding chemotaxis protein CheW